MVFKIVLLVAGLLAEVLATLKDGKCCGPNEVVRRRKSGPPVCWEPQTNATSSVILTCNETAAITPIKDQFDFYVNDYGQLIMQLPNLEVEYEPTTFCVGNITTRNLNASRLFVAFLCVKDEDGKLIDEEVYGFCMVISCILLLVTAFIYTVLAELRDLQGKSIINFSLSLGIGLGIMAGMKLVPYSDMGLCAARGFLAYFFIIVSFFWTNAISIQILRSVRRPTVVNYGWREFIYYAIYAWGIPAVLTIAMAAINFAPGKHLKPGIGLNHCWFFNGKQQWQYMYSVMSILIAINLGIFVYTSLQLWRHSFSSSHVKALKYKFVMTIRLFIVMGVAWIFEMIGTLVKSHIIWEILDIINSLQGFMVFLVVVVFRKRVIKAMLKRGWLDCIAGPVERWLAVGEDEEGVVQHTIGVSMDDTKNKI